MKRYVRSFFSRLSGVMRQTTIRQQIFAGTFVVLLVCCIAMGWSIFRSLSGMIQDNTNRMTERIVMQADESVERFLNQVEIVTLQIAIDPRIQTLLSELKAREDEGESRVEVDEKMTARLILGELRFYVASITALELYAADREVIYPVDRGPLDDRIEKRWIDEADRRPGELIWVGSDPLSPNDLLAIRQIRLETDRYFSGGYLVVRVSRDLIPFFSPDFPKLEDSELFLFDAAGRLITTTRVQEEEDAAALFGAEGPVEFAGERYAAVRAVSSLTNWVLVMLTPLHKNNEGISLLRQAIVLGSLISAALLLLMATGLSTLITSPVRKLVRTMRGPHEGIPKKNPAYYFNRDMNELILTYNDMIDRMNELVSTVYVKELMQSRAELQALQAQINPHFLYNTLEAFYWLLKEKGEDELASKLIGLSRMFRYTVSDAEGTEWVTIADEVRHAEQYMSLILLRFADRIRYETEVDPALLHVPIPKLVVQPLVENAIYHGIEPVNGSGTVKLSVRKAPDGDGVTIRVEDDGGGMDERFLERAAAAQARADAESREGGARRRGTGIGLLNIHRRLRQYYGPAGGLSIRSSPERGTTVEMTILERG
ncbi:sensor histidine kinase [Paenibacillus sp.]|uniref:sensor histidine kinase n=1 Tax=Paenibacillus sp. TaxID=58172 RepID=UPI0028116AAA|nr:sensor histidine kinase [Paenibacillus sp.]